MAIIRACSYTATIQTPENPANYSAINITFAQDGANLISKSKSNVTIQDNKVIVNLDQSETKLFTCGKKAYLQIRCFESQYNAPGSMVWAIDVYPALNDEVLS